MCACRYNGGVFSAGRKNVGWFSSCAPRHFRKPTFSQACIPNPDLIVQVVYAGVTILASISTTVDIEFPEPMNTLMQLYSLAQVGQVMVGSGSATPWG